MSDTTSLLLLLLAFLCLAFWINTFKLASARWRFEFFTLDFAFGLLAIAALAALTLGNFASELGLADRILVASKTAQALTAFGGFVFGLGALTGFGAIRLLGISTSLSASLGLAFSVNAALSLRTASNWWLPCIAIVLLLLAVICSLRSARRQDNPIAAPKNSRQPARAAVRKSTKGILLALLSGAFLVISGAVTISGVSGDFGLGAFAGTLVFAAGVLVSVVPFSIFLLNITIDLPPGTLRNYWSKVPQQPKGQHVFGLLGGALWATGTLAFLSQRLSGSGEPGRAPVLVAAVAIIASVLSGVILWKEAKLTKAKGLLVAGLLLFASGALIYAF